MIFGWPQSRKWNYIASIDWAEASDSRTRITAQVNGITLVFLAEGPHLREVARRREASVYHDPATLKIPKQHYAAMLRQIRAAIHAKSVRIARKIPREIQLELGLG